MLLSSPNWYLPKLVRKRGFVLRTDGMRVDKEGLSVVFNIVGLIFYPFLAHGAFIGTEGLTLGDDTSDVVSTRWDPLVTLSPTEWAGKAVVAGIRVVFNEFLAHGAIVDGIATLPDEVGISCLGWFAIWMETAGSCASLSLSKLNNDPKGKCWTTGNLDNTSALYILSMPWSV